MLAGNFSLPIFTAPTNQCRISNSQAAHPRTKPKDLQVEMSENVRLEKNANHLKHSPFSTRDSALFTFPLSSIPQPGNNAPDRSQGGIMCGIVAYVGRKIAQPLLIEGLKRLEYRGYDSAGIAVIDD